MRVAWTAFLFFQLFGPESHCSRILAISVFGPRSHKIVFDALTDNLSQKGHQMVTISGFKNVAVNNSFVTEILHEPFDPMANTNSFDARRLGNLGLFFRHLVNLPIVDSCEKLYNQKEIQDLLKQSGHFDLIISDPVTSFCACGIISHFQQRGASHISLITLPSHAIFSNLIGNRSPLSFVPEPYLPYTDRMNIFQRTHNFLWANVVSTFFRAVLWPRVERVYQKYVPEAKGVAEVRTGASMLFMNTHFTLHYPRPLTPNVIEVGGMHCKPGQPLPPDLDTFLNSASKGFILVSFGSVVKAHQMPDSIRKVFLNVFTRLGKEMGIRVLWKWETEEMPEAVPDNVKLIKWVPQQDVLAHQNIKLFIMHGGLLGYQEAVYHGVPMICFPFYGDTDAVAFQAQVRGYSLTLEILEVTEKILENAILETLTNKRYAEQVKILSEIYRDKPQAPLEKAVYWAEYVIRHKGASHLSPGSKDLNFIQYYSIDVVVLLCICAVGFIYVLKLLLWKLIKKTGLFLKLPNSQLKESKIENTSLSHFNSFKFKRG